VAQGVPQRQPPAKPTVQAQPPQTQQAQVQEAQQSQEIKQTQHVQAQQKHSQQPVKPREAKTYAGRIGIRPSPTGYYRQPVIAKATTNGEYQRKDNAGGGRGRGKPRGARAQGTQEFRAISKEPTPSLFVSNLPDGADENAVTNVFKKFGTVKSVDFPNDKNFCFVHFETQEGVDKAMSTEEELLWDGFSVWYEPKRLPTPRGTGRGADRGVPRVTSNDTKQSDGKVQNQDQKQPQQPKQNVGKQQNGGKQQQSTGKQQQSGGKQQQSGGKQPQNQNQDGEGPWQNVAYRRREKKGDKKMKKK